MKQLYTFLNLFICLSGLSQVGIGTSTPNSSSILELQSTTQAFLPPRMTDVQMLAINSPLNGSIVFNTTADALFVKTTSGWRNFFDISKPTIILNNEFAVGNNLIKTVNNAYDNLPLNSSHLISIDSDTYTLISNGKIRLKKDGIYVVTSNLSVYNLPPGSRKYIISLEKNGSLFGYANRGEVNLTAADDWGTSGSICFTAVAGDVIDVKYVLNNGGVNLDAKILSIGITKLK